MANAFQAYQTNQVNTASQEKLVTMLYDGALRFIAQAKAGIEEKDIEKSNTNFIKAQKIIAELMSNLNREVGEIAENLFLLYDFMYRRLITANVQKDLQAADEVYSLLSELRDTWVEATRQLHNHSYKTNYNSLNITAE
jgi:flagellar protein FliS